MRIAEKLKEAAMEKNFPEVVRPNWAKFSSEKIIQSLSFDPRTLIADWFAT